MRIRITHQRITLFLQSILLLEAVLAIWGQRWFTAFLTSMIIVITLFPILFERRFRIHIPPELQLAAIGFVFASLFLGRFTTTTTGSGGGTWRCIPCLASCWGFSVSCWFTS